MRRDLAVARTKSGAEAASKPTKIPTTTKTAVDAPRSGNAQPNSDPVATTASDQPQPEPSKENQPQPVASPKKRSSPSLEDDTSFAPAAKKQAVGNDNPASAEAPTSNRKLELNTNSAKTASGEQSAEDKAPDTGTFSNTGDLDSLFNDTASGGGMGGDNGDEPDFSTSADLNAEFDMASFTNGLDANKSNGNDNISALLPGLQDYANDTAGAEPDFRDPSGAIRVDQVPAPDAWIGHRTVLFQEQSHSRIAWIDRLGEGMLPHRESVLQEGDIMHLVMREADAAAVFDVIASGPDES